VIRAPFRWLKRAAVFPALFEWHEGQSKTEVWYRSSKNLECALAIQGLRRFSLKVDSPYQGTLAIFSVKNLEDNFGHRSIL
jgi:hypothetical protein